jgi:hypothetical protein
MMEMEEVCFSETSVPTYKSTRRHKPEDHDRRLRVFENKMLRRISGKKTREVTEDLIRLFNEELQHLFSQDSLIFG